MENKKYLFYDDFKIYNKFDIYYKPKIYIPEKIMNRLFNKISKNILPTNKYVKKYKKKKYILISKKNKNLFIRKFINDLPKNSDNIIFFDNINEKYKNIFNKININFYTFFEKDFFNFFIRYVKDYYNNDNVRIYLRNIKNIDIINIYFY